MKRFCFLICLFLVSNIFAETLTIVTSNETYSFELTEIQNITFSGTVSVEDMTTIVNSVPIEFLRNYPNPFNPETTISFELNSKGKTKLEIFNIKGQKVKELVNEKLSAGQHNIVWNGTNNNNKRVASGVYFYSLTHKNKSIAKKMILMK